MAIPWFWLPDIDLILNRLQKNAGTLEADEHNSIQKLALMMAHHTYSRDTCLPHVDQDHLHFFEPSNSHAFLHL